jgi:hypothetical protein
VNRGIFEEIVRLVEKLESASVIVSFLACEEGVDREANRLANSALDI